MVENNRDLIIILDGDALHGQFIAKKVRELGVYCEIVNSNAVAVKKIAEFKPLGVILTGNLNMISEDFFDLNLKTLEINESCQKQIPSIEITSNRSKLALDEEKLRDFLYETCGAKGDWTMKKFAEQMIADLKVKIGDKKVLCALSGGVDSTVSAVLVHRAVGDQLSCVLVDTGLMRLNECAEVEKVFNDVFEINLKVIDAEDRFLSKLADITDPEQKRKIIGEEFIRVFEEEAKKIGKVGFLVQGTIYPDIIESGKGTAALVKSHHNVGGLPDVIDFEEIIEPLRDLFKDEVRALGLELGIPESLVWRQPFPGPGLGIRVIGALNKEKLDVLRAADAIFREEILANKLNLAINQYFAVLTNMRTVGVKNGERTYGYVLALRAVETSDFMTAEWAQIPFELIAHISERITTGVAEVTRVVYDITAKPPGTIEWE